MKLLFLSNTESIVNKNVKKEILKLINKLNFDVGYIPTKSISQNDPYNKFELVKSYYQKLGAKSFVFFDLDKKLDSKKLSKLKKCDLIHLSGGDTFYFLHTIRKTRFDRFLKEYTNSSGVLAGVSAGAMIMSQTIMATVVKGHHQDLIELKDYSALGLVDFEFMPHYDYSQKINDKFVQYSQKSPYPIYACPDGSAIMVNDNKTKFIGKITRFYKGKIYEPGI